jgi:hypothetical protein
LEPISSAEFDARLDRVVAIARGLGFVGEVHYRHGNTTSGGATYCLAPAIEQDTLIVYAAAFSRDASGDDFSLEAIIAHERGHQLLYRNERLLRVRPKEMSETTEEVLASLVGSLIVQNDRDGELLEMKALFELMKFGIKMSDALQLVKKNLRLLEGIL